MEKYTGLEMAVIGLSGRFPKADTIEEYWENIKNGRDCISTFSNEELLEEGESEEMISNPLYVRANAFLQNKNYFDAAFFGYRPDEADLMDPQIRIFHECCWAALEDSGYTNTAQKERIGLFAAGTPNVNWELHAYCRNREGLVNEFSASHLRQISFLSSSVSYKLNLKGPSVFLQTGCSSSLVAIHEACNSLLLGECTLALAGGITIHNFSKRGYLYKPGMIMSKDGKCRPFDIHSSGTVGGEGVGVVVLKRLKDAIRDRDHIYALVKGSAINNDGNSKVGYTAPGVKGQAEAVRKAHKMAAVEPGSISYVETHGTATELGDPIEIEALKEAFGNCRPKTCAIGSVKSNMGHLDAAAGVAGFIKTVLAIRNRQLPASLHFTQPNSKIDFDNSPFYVNTSLCAWEPATAVLRAGVSSFGIGGTNAHIVLEEAPATNASSAGRYYQLLMLSGKTPAALQANADKLLTCLQRNSHLPLADIAYTLQKGRVRFQYRRMMVCRNHEEAIRKLASGEAADNKTIDPHEESQPVIFMFSGQGAQYAGMCRDLYLKEKLFSDKVNECLSIAARYTKADLAGLLLSNNKNSGDIDHTQYAQPLLFIVEYSLAHLLMHWGIKPAYMIGHSIGEYVAACLSGVFSLEDALRLVIRRGELMAEAERGSMLSINIHEQELQPFLAKYAELDLAVVNSAGSLVVAGRTEAIEAFEKELVQHGYETKRLHTSHAFHSAMMDTVLESFEEEVKLVTINEPRIPYISNITGEWVQYHEIREPAYWSRHLRSTVQFLHGTQTLLRQQNGVYIEIGPGRALCNYVSKHAAIKEGHTILNTVRQANQPVNDNEYLIMKLGQLWLSGIRIDWDAYYAGEQRNRVSLPGYSFEKIPYTTLVDARKLLINGNGAAASTAMNVPGGGIHISGWQRSLLPNSVTEERDNTTFVVLADQQGFAEALTAALTTERRRVIMVKPGAAFKQLGEDIYEADVRALSECWKHLEEKGVQVHHIVYCGALDDATTISAGYEDIDEKLGSGYLALSYLATSVAAIRSVEKIQLTVINNNLAFVMEDDLVNPLKATVHGPARIIPSEILHVRCKVIDISFSHWNDRALKEYLPLLINELLYDSEDAFVAYRCRARWVPSFELLPDHVQLRSKAEIVHGGTYIITGGFGGMGFTIAADLAQQYRVNIVLVHRSFFPLRSQWQQWLHEKGAQDAISKKIQQLLKMEENGSRVNLYQLDVAAENEVRDFAKYISEEFPEVNGLIWAAGEVDHGGIIQQRPAADLLKYISSKVHGLLLFEKYLDLKKLNFISLFSSIGNVFYQTKFGQVAYNAANEFLEAYANYAQKKTGIHVFTINWCDWLDVGMTVRTKMKELEAPNVGTANAQISNGISPREGVAFFYRCLKSKAPVSTIYKGDITEAVRAERKAFQEQKLILSAPAATGITVNGSDNIEQVLLDLFGRFFGRSSVSVNDDFFELGGDSLKGMTLVARINQKTGAKLVIGDLYQHATVGSLARALLKKQAKDTTACIPRAPLQRLYPLSSAQKRMYFLQLLDNENTVYNEVQLFLVTGQLDKQRLENSFRQLIHRHESLRTAFIFEDGMPHQLINDQFDFHVTYTTAREEELDDVIRNFIRPFDLSSAPLCRMGVAAIHAEKYLLMIDLHHIIEDGVSQGILIRDFMALYNGEPLPPMPLQYKDYSVWQQTSEQDEANRRRQAFWLNEFADRHSVAELPSDYARPLVKSYEGASFSFELSAEETMGLKRIATEEGVSLFMIILSVYTVLLSKLGNREDVVIGTPIAGRQHADLENIIGMFVNMLALRNYPKGELSYRAFLANLKLRTLACFEHQAYQYEELIDALNVERNLNRNSLFDVVFSFKNIEKTDLVLTGQQLQPYTNKQILTKFDLTLWAIERDDQLQFDLEYATCLFKQETIERFAAYLKRIIEAIIGNIDIRLADIEMIKGQEQQQLLQAFDHTAVAFPTNKTVVDLFQEQVKRTPEHTAIKFGDIAITYAQLDERSSRLAHLLIKNKVKADEIVGLLMDRCIETVIAMIGILKSGAAYLPIDVDYPEERQQYLISDSNCAIVVTTREYKHRVSAPVSVLLIEEAGELPTMPQKMLPRNRPSDLCYVIYTSGTTGNPKGVMVEHGNVVRLFFNDKFQFDFGAQDVWTMFHSHCFDFSVWEIYGALLFGGRLIIIPKAMARDTGSYIEVLRKEGVTVLNQTPSAFYNLIQEDLSGGDLSLRYVIFGGEALAPGKLKLWHATYPHVKLVNMFGITETTVHVTYKEIGDREIENNISNVGKPIPTLSVYIFDRYQKLVPAGIIGELYVGGAGVSRGYLGKAELTGSKFIRNPYRQSERLYRSGDLARMLPSGDIEYIGRMDHQVQLRGFRIELGEIESKLIDHNAIKEAVVLAKGYDDDKYLVAYYVTDQEVETTAIREFLVARLPDHMVPSFFMRVKEMPLTSNGKLDRDALPEPVMVAAAVPASPLNEIEEAMVTIWADVLKTDKASINTESNFFELGGHSIRAIHLIKAIQQRFAVKIELRKIFENASIEKLARLIGETGNKNEQIIPAVEDRTYYPATAAQERLFYQQLLDKKSLINNIAVVFNIKGEVDAAKVADTFRLLIKRHESLRTCFVLEGEGLVQKIEDEVPFELIIPAHNYDDSIKAAFDNFVRPFELSNAPLLRCALLPRGRSGHFLFIDIHHIICDGIGLNILIKDFKTLYQGKPLQPVALRYIDYACWLQQSDHRLAKQQAFWQTKLTGELPVLNLSAGDVGGITNVHPASVNMLVLSGELYEKIKNLTAHHQVSDFMFLLSIHFIFLSKMTGNTDIIIGTDVAGRSNPALHEVVGTFVNILPLRIAVAGDVAFDEFLTTVKNTVLEAYDNQDFPFDRMVSLLGGKNEAGKNRIVETHFSFANAAGEEDQLNEIDFVPFPVRGYEITQYQFKIEVAEKDRQFDMSFVFSSSLYDDATINLFVKYYDIILKTVLQNDSIMLNDIALENSLSAV